MDDDSSASSAALIGGEEIGCAEGAYHHNSIDRRRSLASS
jgi:hypothetical protein